MIKKRQKKLLKKKLFRIQKNLVIPKKNIENLKSRGVRKSS